MGDGHRRGAFSIHIESGKLLLVAGLTASLMGCTAFPWALPELSERLLEHVGRYVQEGSYRHLYFTSEADLWPHLT